MMARGDLESAEVILRAVVEMQETSSRCKNWTTGSAKCSLGTCLAGRGDTARGEQLLLEGLRFVEATLPERNKQRLACLRRVIEFYESKGEIALAAQYRSQLPE